MSNAGIIGKKHNAHLNWLLNTWMTSSSNSPVCFLEGFPGTGKTTIAKELLTRIATARQTAILITAPETESDPTDDILLDLAMELNRAGRDELARAIENNRPLREVLISILEDPILIVIDEFQRSMQGSRAITMGGFAKVLSTVATRRWLKGRILLLTNRYVERARWSEPYEIRTLSGMSPDDGVELLEYLARENERLNEITPERRHDIVKWLGGNPRAIRLVVSSLVYESLDDLIGIQPELWEMRDREVSPELVADLERNLLEKTLSQLSDNYLLALYRLSVHRKPFRREAIEKLFDEKSVYAQFKREITERFLMEQHNSWCSLHPIVREIGLQRLADSAKDIQQAHHIAARYYTRHFEATQIVGWGALGGHFVEARYHIVKAGRPDDLKNIASRFQSYIFSTLSGNLTIPSNPEELDERIAVLSALLETTGPRNLDYHLARLFQARNQRNDLRRALHHAHRAKSNTFVAPWLLCGDLLFQMERYEEAIIVLKQGIERVSPENDCASLINRCSHLLAQQKHYDEAIDLLLEGIKKIPPNKSLASLYISCGELLIQRERDEEAITVLKEGINRISADKSLSDLYISCGKLLARLERYDEAIAVLERGINCIPADKNLVSLYISCGELLVQTQQNNKAITLLKKGINSIPADKGLFALYACYAKILVFVKKPTKAIEILLDGINKIPEQSDTLRLIELVLLLYAALRDEKGIYRIFLQDIQPVYKALAQSLLYQVQGRWKDAAEHAQEKRNNGIHSNQLVVTEAFSWLCAGLPEQALDALSTALTGNKSANHWLNAFIQLHLGNFDKAKNALAAYDEQLILLPEANRKILLTLWDQPSVTLEQFDLAYYFPTLPSSLTGLPYSATRIVFHPSVLPDEIKTKYPPNDDSTQKQENTMDNTTATKEDTLENYIDFDLHIGASGEVVAYSNEGQATDRISTQPPNDINLALKLIKLRQIDAELLKDIGISLYNWLFPNSIHTHFHQTEAVARRDKAKLRLRLRIEPATIASLPLEFTYRSTGGYFLATNPDTVFSRYLNLPLPPDRVRRRQGSLHLLAIIADPTDQVRLNPDEWEAIIMEALAKPLAEKKITLRTVKQATRKDISNALREQKPDIVQFIGHGIYQDGKGYIALVDQNTGKTWLVDDELFANLFMGYDDHLGLVSMATCESAQSNNPQGFLGITPQLVQRGGIPAVVAMQYAVRIETAKVFLEEFYTSVAARKPIDWAVQQARNAISLEFKLDNREFATPVLYMRAKDGNVF